MGFTGGAVLVVLALPVFRPVLAFAARFVSFFFPGPVRRRFGLPILFSFHSLIVSA